jgi:hypothetical protein
VTAAQVKRSVAQRYLASRVELAWREDRRE